MPMYTYIYKLMYIYCVYKQMGFCLQDGKVEGHALIFSCWDIQNYNSLMNNHQQENVGSHRKKIPMSRGKEEPQQDSRRGEITFRIKFHTPQRHSESESCSVMSDSLRPHGLYGPWNSPGQNTGVGSLSLLQGIFPTLGLNPGLPRLPWWLRW